MSSQGKKMVVNTTFVKDNEPEWGARYSEAAMNKKYSYMTDLDLKVGDKVVVSVDGKFKVVEVVDIDVTTNKATKWVVDKVDVDGYKNREKRRQEISRLERVLAQKVAAKKAELKVQEVLADDTEAMDMLKTLKELQAQV